MGNLCDIFSNDNFHRQNYTNNINVPLPKFITLEDISIKNIIYNKDISYINIVKNNITNSHDTDFSDHTNESNISIIDDECYNIDNNEIVEYHYDHKPRPIGEVGTEPAIFYLEK